MDLPYLNGWSKVKSDSTKRFAAYGFLKVNWALQTSRTNNKQGRGTFMWKRHGLIVKEWSKVVKEEALCHF